MKMRLVPPAALLLATLALGLTAGCSRVISAESILHPPPAQDTFSMERTLTIELDYGAGRQRAIAQPAEIVASDGVKLRGWYFHNPEYRRYVIFLHGTLGIMERSERFLAWMSLYLRANVLAIDYRGYGYSEGKPTITLLADDALAVYDALAARAAHPDDPIFVFGYSLGTAIACNLAAQRDTAGVILLASFTCAEDFCATAGPAWYRLFNRVTADASLCDPRQPIDNIRDLREPLLIIHGTKDIVTTLSLGREMFAAAGTTDKELVEVPGKGHEDLSVSVSPVRERLLAFVERATTLRQAAVAKIGPPAEREQVGK